jgi:hypothetical protein
LAEFIKNIAKKLLKKYQQPSKAEALKTLRETQEVGVVYDAKLVSESSLNKVVHYFEAEGKNVITMGYYSEKELGTFVPNYKEEYFCKKDLNFWGLPKKESIQRFTNKDFDYLVNLDMKGSIQLQAVSVYSKAKTRIGKHIEDYDYAQDFMVKTHAQSHEVLFEEIKKYIK